MEGANFQQVLANNFHDYVKIFLVDVATLFGLGIFFHDGPGETFERVNQANLLGRQLSDVDALEFTSKGS